MSEDSQVDPMVTCANCYQVYDGEAKSQCPSCMSSQTMMKTQESPQDKLPAFEGPLPTHYVITGLTRKLGKLEMFALRSSLRKLDFSDEVVDDFITDIANEHPRHPLGLLQTGMPEGSADVNVTIRALERSGFNARICTCTGQGIESELDKSALVEDLSVELLDRAIAEETGAVRAAMKLVRENLLATESCEWVGRATVRAAAVQSAGCIVLTDQNYWVGHFDNDLSLALADRVERVSGDQILRLRGSGQEGVFRIEGLAVQSITVSPSELLDLEECARTSLDRAASSGEPEDDALTAKPETQPQVTVGDSGTSGALVAMRELQALLDAGFITEEEFQAKKQDILKRL